MKTLFLTIALLAFSFNANAVSITETTNPILDQTFLDVGAAHWDTTTDLNWLNIADLVNGPITLGYSINEAVAQYGPQGWRLPTHTEVYDLFDTFFEPDFVASSNGTMTLAEGDGQSTLIQSRNSWMLDFGTDAEIVNGSIDPNDALLYSTGMYLDENGAVQVLGIKFDVPNLTTTIYGPGFDLTGWTRDSAYTNMGVFMVQNHVVPVPPAVWLFGSGLLGLVGIARRKA